MSKHAWIKSKWLWVSGAVCILAAVAVWIAIPKPGINHENFLKIQVDMTVDEVSALMGHPPGEYWSKGASMSFGSEEQWGDISKCGPSGSYWLSNEARIEICLDENKRVCYAQFIRINFPSLWERICKCSAFS